MPETSEVTADQLSFIVRCVQRAQAFSVDSAAYGQSSRTLAWLSSHEASRGIVERATTGSRGAQFTGRAVMQWAQALTASW